MNTMVDRPIFAFEPSFLDRLPHQYDRNLDPTSDDVMVEASNDETRDDEINETDTEFLKRPIPQRVPTAAASSSRVASSGSVNTAGSNSLWFLRKQHQHQRASKRSTSGSSQFVGGPSVNSFFSFPATSMNSLNSLGSLSSINSFLKGIGGSSVDSLKGFGASMDSLGVIGTSEDVSAMEDAPSTGIIRQVTPEEYRGRNRYHDTAATTSTTPSVTMRTSTSTPSSFSHHPLYPDAPAASAKSAATLINLYSQANNKESKTITTNATTAMVKQPVPTFLDGTGATAISSTTTKAATLSSTKTKSKRVAAKKSTKSKNTSSQPKKRIRRKEPVVRKYVVANEKDVLLGRGGGSNHHPGNIAYRQEILRLQPEYKLLDRDAKTAMSEQVVQWVLQQKQGRFLKRECKASPWYIVTDATARQKVSQALREDHTPEGRALKKSRTTYKAPKKSRKKN